MTPPLAPDDITLLRSALAALQQQYNAFSNIAAQLPQGRAQTCALIAVGDRIQHIHVVDCLLRDQQARLTGMPAIQHGNTDLHDPAAPAPLSPADEAHQANHRG